MMNRELQVYLPMFRLLKGLQGDAGFSEVTRKWVLWNSIPAEQLPWLCVCSRPQERVQQTVFDAPGVYTIMLDVWIVAAVGEADNRDEVLNPLLDQLCNLFDWNPNTGGGRQTLGGAVHWAKIDGDIPKAGGVMGDDRCLAVVPISVIVAGSPNPGVTKP